MLYLKSFCFNPFQENTYLLYTNTGNAFIIDPGNSNNTENQVLKNFIHSKNLNPSKLLLTHAHIDHVLGNNFIFNEYKLLPELHKADIYFIENLQQSAQMYGIEAEASPTPKKFINHNDVILLDEYELHCFHTPGHSPGSISFYNQKNNILISGDVLFKNSIGRTDLPMGDFEALITSIKTHLFTLPNETKVYSGHGPATTIREEKQNNPFLN
ncbi:MAG: MBL fold metallo-hydrolase [Bacteroidetes bacterium]|nr:MBL fold metallo-hydrolase [Bacteroidota bacterium]